MPTRRLGFAVKVLGRGDLPSHDTRRWQSNPDLSVSIAALQRILAYLGETGIRMYRITSDFVPYGTHPDMPRFHRQIEENAADLRPVGRYAQEQDVRLSIHPSPYVVLNARDPSIREKAVLDLDQHARLLDAMEQDARAVVVLHIGGLYGDRQRSLERFVRGVEALSEPARRRLVVENDEASFTLEDCLCVHERTGRPVVFDHQHHRLNPGALDVETAARLALATWANVVPKIHFSSPRLDGREIKRGGRTRLQAPLLRQHADYVDPWTFAEFVGALRDLEFDIMLEAKAKDLAVFKLQRELAQLGLDEVLRSPNTVTG